MNIDLEMNDMDIENRDFSNQDLTDVNFNQSNLTEVNFANCDLTGANFSSANLEFIYCCDKKAYFLAVICFVEIDVSE